MGAAGSSLGAFVGWRDPHGWKSLKGLDLGLGLVGLASRLLPGESADWSNARGVIWWRTQSKSNPSQPPKFPANREINRELRRNRPLDAILNADTPANSEACSEIPYSTEQGIFAKEQGICTREQGILNQDIGHDFRA